MTETTLQCIRGCGERKENALYLSCGTSPYGIPIKERIIDPAISWEHGWQRGYTLFEIDDTGVKHVLIFVGKEYYPSPWSFVEEAKRFGISRRIDNKFPVDQLTPGQSKMFFAHAYTIPLFEYYLPEHPKDCKCQDADLGWHYDVDKHCTFGLKNLAVNVHSQKDISLLDADNFIEIRMPGFSFFTSPIMDAPPLDEQEYKLGIFLYVPITHLEVKNYIDPEVQSRIRETDYKLEILDY
jgi:hypothetical protein